MGFLSVSVNVGGILTADGGDGGIIANNIRLQGGTIGTQSVNTTYSGGISVQSASFLGSPPTASGGSNNATGVFTLANTVFGIGSLTKMSTDTCVLSGANQYLGKTTIAAGVLNLNKAEIANASGPLGKQTASAVGTIVMTGGTLQYSAVNQFDYSGRMSTTGGQSWNIDTNGQIVTFAKPLQGTGSTLTKAGAGTLFLAAADTYTGNTVVNAGSLLVNGSLTSAVSIATGATLGGSGTVGDVTSLAGNAGTVSPGSPGTDAALTVGNLVLGVGTLLLNLDGTSSYDSVRVAGSTIDLTSTVLSLAITPANIHAGETYTIIANPNNDPIISTFANAAEGSPIVVSGQLFTITYQGGTSGHDVVLTAQGSISIVSGFPTLNANPHNDPRYAYIAHAGQHSMVESVAYSFSNSITLSRSDFTITNKGPANIGGSNFAAYVPDLIVTGSDNNTLWTVTFANHVVAGVERQDGVSDTTGSIGDGKYELVLNAASGLTNTYDFYRLLGDVNHRGTVDGPNFQAFITAFNQTPGTELYVGAFDFDGGSLNPTVNGADFQTLVTNFNHTVGDIAGFN